MAGFCLLALIVGAVAAAALPVVPFVFGLLIACVVGLGCALALLPQASTVVAGALAIYACAQAGYGLGLGILAFFPTLRRWSSLGQSFEDGLSHPGAAGGREIGF